MDWHRNSSDSRWPRFYINESRRLQREYHHDTSMVRYCKHHFSGLTLYAYLTKEYKSYRILFILTVLGVSFAGHYGAMLTHGEDYLALNPAEKKLAWP